LGLAAADFFAVLAFLAPSLAFRLAVLAIRSSFRNLDSAAISVVLSVAYR
jgi:hypothetical protein